jgi:hypothetical protein
MVGWGEKSHVVYFVYYLEYIFFKGAVLEDLF